MKSSAEFPVCSQGMFFQVFLGAGNVAGGTRRLAIVNTLAAILQGPRPRAIKLLETRGGQEFDTR